MKHKEFLSQLDSAKIVEAIHRTEQCSSSEVRVHIDPSVRGRDIRAVAERTFERLGMTKTAQRNGVLLFIAAEEQQFTILGDKGIHERVPEHFWEEVAEKISGHFKEHRFTEGIVDAIDEVASHLSVCFPIQPGDVNELANEVSFGETTPRDSGNPESRK
jgi:uncharacterized membrane protein